MPKQEYMLLSNAERREDIDLYEKKKLQVIRVKLYRIFGVLHKEFEDISDEYKATLVSSFLINLFPMIGVLRIDKEKFLSQMAMYYDMAVEADNDSKIEFID